MKIISIRQGFATNSSSLHSIIINRKYVDDYSKGKYGWDGFMCASKEAKIHYFFANLIYNMHHQNYFLPEYIESFNKYFNTKYSNKNEDYSYYVDHQSALIIPRYQLQFGNKFAMDFYFDFASNIINNDDIAITGGNDNEEDINAQLKGKIEIADVHFLYRFLKDSEICLIRKEKWGWIIFNMNNGEKIRVTNSIKEKNG